jgi:hypothetical protein
MFLVIILAGEKSPTDGANVSNSQKNDGPGGIRILDLRRVKTEALGVFEAFSVGDITVRKANDPLYIV